MPGTLKVHENREVSVLLPRPSLSSGRGVGEGMGHEDATRGPSTNLGVLEFWNREQG